MDSQYQGLMDELHITPTTPHKQSEPERRTWEQVARIAQAAWAANIGNTTIPPYDSLPASLQTAWQVAVRAAGYAMVHAEVPDASFWRGWQIPVPTEQAEATAQETETSATIGEPQNEQPS